MVTVEVNMSDGIGNLAELSKEAIQSGLDKTAQDLIRNLMINSPEDHGLLKQWAVTNSDESSRTIQSPAIYAAAQNYGSTHWISPKNAKALHWSDGAGEHFSKGHEITIPAKHFVEDSIEQTQSRIAEFFTINTGG